MIIRPLPTPPSRADGSDVFADRGDLFLSAIPGFADDANLLAAELNTLADELNTLADEVSANTATVAAAVPGAVAAANFKGDYSAIVTYQIGQSVAYAGATWFAKTVNLGVAPSIGANWQKVDVIPPQAGLGGAMLGTNGTTMAWVTAMPSVEYDSRATLRSLTPIANSLIIVMGLGLFRWVSGSLEPDDDETAFTTSLGVWELELPHLDLISAQWLFDADAVNDNLSSLVTNLATLSSSLSELRSRWSGRVRHGSAVNAITSVASLSQVAFTGTVVGAIVGDKVLVNPPTTFGSPGISVYATVTSTNTVTVYLNNASASTFSSGLTGTFNLTVFSGV